MAVLREQRKDATRRRLYEAALEIFRRDEVAACRIDDIATAAGVSRGSFYFHYPTKEHVLIEHMRETEIQITTAINALPESTPLGTVLDTVSAELAVIWQPDPRLLPDIVAVALRFTATNLTQAESGTLRETLRQRFAAAAQRNELSTLLPSEILGDLYLGNMLAGLLAWYGHKDTSLKVVLQSTNMLFFGGVAVGMDRPAVGAPSPVVAHPAVGAPGSAAAAATKSSRARKR